MRGSNQTGMRAHNERLVLSLIRKHGPMAKAAIARMTGLSAQTVSVIMRALEADGLLVKGEPVRGKVGQPSVPMGLRAQGAYFLGLKVGWLCRACARCKTSPRKSVSTNSKGVPASRWRRSCSSASETLETAVATIPQARVISLRIRRLAVLSSTTKTRISRMSVNGSRGGVCSTDSKQAEK